MAALWMCGELVAPESTYVQVREALKRVRQQFGTLIPRLRELKFRHEWSSRFVNPVLTAQGAADYRAGHHFEIDSLTELLNGEIIDTTVHISGNRFQVRIQFAGRLRIDSVESIYLEIPTVASIVHYGWIGDSENVYPWRLSDGRLTLLFRDAWGDCENGCIENHFWYFRISGESLDDVGEYIRYVTDPIPDWWGEAKAGYYHFDGRD